MKLNKCLSAFLVFCSIFSSVQLPIAKASITTPFRACSDLGTTTACYELDESSGTRTDSSGNGHNLTDNNTVASVAENYWDTDNSADFEKDNSEYLSTADSDDFYLSGDFSVGFWIKYETINTSSGAQIGIFSQFENGTSLMTFAAFSNRIKIQKSGAEIELIYPSTLVAGKWYHISVTRSGNIWAVYLNGNIFVTTNNSFTFTNVAADFRLGRDAINTDAYYDGYLRDFFLVKGTVLSPSQIKSLALGISVTSDALRPNSSSIPTPTAYWKLNEVSDTSNAITRVATVGGNNLTDNATVTTFGGYIEGAAADFEAGNSEYLSAGDVHDLTTSYSMSLWFKPESVSITQVFIGKSNGLTGYQFGLNTSGKMFIQNTVTTSTDTGASLLAGTWYHLAVVYDTSANTATFYLDGKQNSSVAAITDAVDTAHNFGIGRRDSTDYADGLIADVAIWDNVTLSAAYVASIASGLPLQRTGLVSYWKFDEASGNATDSFGTNTLTETSGTIASTTGQVGNSRDLEDADTEYFAIADGSQTGLDITNDLTITGWFKPESVGAIQELVSKGADVSTYHIRQAAANQISMIVSNVSTTGTGTASAGTFYHWSGIVNGEHHQIWRNSVNETNTASSTFASDTSDAFHIGAVSPTPSQYVDGLVDEFAIASRYFREEEVKTVYIKGTNAKELTSQETLTGGRARPRFIMVD